MLFKIKTLLAKIQKLFLTILAVIFLSACSPRVIEKVEYRNDTLYQVQHLRDSVYLHDSINTFVYTSGDTVYINKFKSVIKYREKLKIDTLRQVKEIVKKDTKVIEVKKKQGKFQIFIFGLLLGGLLLLILEKYVLLKNRNS